MNGWIDLIRIEDAEVVISKEFGHITGNITLIKKTDRPNEVMLGTERGLYFVLIGRGLGILEEELQRFDIFQ